jgi:cation transport ATPase
VEEGVAPAGRSRFLAKIAGLHCSLCTGTHERAIGRLPGVHKVGVSLTHEQALVEYDARLISPQELLRTLSSQVVKRLLDLQPETARVVRDGREVEVEIEDVGWAILCVCDRASEYPSMAK